MSVVNTKTRTEAFAEFRKRPLRPDMEIKLLALPKAWDRGPARGQGGFQFGQLLQNYEPRTVGAATRLATMIQATPSQVKDHLWWAYTEGCLEIDGKMHPEVPESPVPVG
jgi:hypothetical protein